MKKGKKGSKPKQPPEKVLPPPAQTIPRSKFSRGAKIAWTSIAGLATLLGFLVALPRISVVPSSPNLNPLEPFLTPFILSNDGYFSVYLIRYNCLINSVEFDTGVSIEDILVTNFIPLRSRLSPTEKDSFLCSFKNAVGGRPTKTADIIVKIDFQNLFGFQQNKPYRFVAEKAADGQLYWLPRAMK